MFEALVTHYSRPLYFGEQIAADIGILNEEFQAAREIGMTALQAGWYIEQSGQLKNIFNR